jgi:NifU-like protein involved in Fe-S cluster formation
MLSEAIVHHVAHPHRRGPLPNATSVGQQGLRGQGPYMLIALRMESDTILEAGFETYGCPSAIACGSWITQWAEGRTTQEISKIQPHDLKLILSLPLGKESCATLAVEALKKAVEGCHAKAAAQEHETSLKDQMLLTDRN